MDHFRWTLGLYWFCGILFIPLLTARRRWKIIVSYACLLFIGQELIFTLVLKFYLERISIVDAVPDFPCIEEDLSSNAGLLRHLHTYPTDSDRKKACNYLADEIFEIDEENEGWK